MSGSTERQAVRLPTRRRLRRRVAAIAARCAMASWVVLAAMPVVAVVATLG